MSVSLRNVRTKPYTELVFEDQIKSSVRSAKAEISEILHSLKCRSAVFTYRGQIITAVPVDFPRLLAEWGTKTKVQQSVRNIITSALFSAEEKCAGSALTGAAFWISETESVVHTKRRSTRKEMELCLSYFGGSGMAKCAAIAIIDQGGLGCKVEFEETPGPVTRILAKSGREILGDVDPLFGDRVGRNFNLGNCIVVAVNGVVESVSSLHNVLTASSDVPVVVLAETFLPDVSNTMAETWKSGRGKCLPFVTKKWGVESFLDLEKQGLLCVSNERGDTISGLKLESSRGLEVTVEKESCTISSPDINVNSKLVIEISQSLGGLTGLAKDRIKMLVGHARLCARSGVTEWEKLSKESPLFSDLFSKELVISSSSVVGGLRASESLRKVLQELGCLILIAQGEKS